MRFAVRQNKAARRKPMEAVLPLIRSVVSASALFAALDVRALEVEPPALVGELKKIQAAARSGDYAAQRNLAYTYSTGGFELRGTKYPVAGCAWYLAMPHFNQPKITAGDGGNVKVYCGSLDIDQIKLAMQYSAQLVAQFKK